MVDHAGDLPRRNRELSILHAMAEALNRSTDPEQALDTALSRTTELLDLECGWIWLLNEDTGQAYLAAGKNLPPALEEPRRMEGGCTCLDRFARGALRDGAASMIECSRLSASEAGTQGYRFHASLPLVGRSGHIGMLNVASVDWRELDTQELSLLHTIADLVAITVERARLFARRERTGAVEERNRLAREIHDTLAQGLAGISVQLETVDALLESGSDPGAARSHLAEALSLVRTGLEDARRSVLDLRAAPLDGQSLDEALRTLSVTAMEGCPPVEVHVTGSSHTLPPNVEMGLYRIAAEALANAARHADASRVEISLVVAPSRVDLVVDDDGSGFDPDQPRDNRFGLAGMSERARLLGGSLHLESAPNRGTRVTVTAPLGAGR